MKPPTKTPRTPRTRTLRTLTAAAPLAVAALMAAAPQASAAIGGAALENPHVADQGRTLNVTLGSAITDAATDNAIAGGVAQSLLGGWAGNLMQYAAQHAPQPEAACRATVTATDPNGAHGSVSTVVKPGVADNQLNIPDQARGTTWASGDVDHFTAQITCSDTKRGTQISRATIEQDQMVG
jgi:hypothetical protein